METKWMKFGSESQNIHFVGKDVITITNGLHILFYDLVAKTHTIYKANSKEQGNGVSCIAGYKVTPLFAFAEKCLHPRILVMEYPTFTAITTIPGKNNDQILALAFAEMEYLISLGSLPNYEITIWSWRTGDKLISEKSGIISVNQLFRCSPNSPPVVAQASVDSATIVLWEAHSCFKNCLLTRLEFNIESAEPPCNFTWSPDGILIIIDAAGKFFMIEVDKRKLQHIFNWTGNNGDIIPSITWHKGGVVVAGPCGDVKHFKRTGATEWQTTWSLTPESPFTVLTTCLGKDYIIGFSDKGHLHQFMMTDEGPRCYKIATYGKNFTQMCFINPVGDYLATLNSQQIIHTWHVDTGEMIGEYVWKQNCLSLESNPVLPYFVLGREDGIVDFINVFTPKEPKLMTQVNLCHDGISGVDISPKGTHVIPCIMEKGLFFVIKSDPGEIMYVKSYTQINETIAQFTVMEKPTELILTVLIKTRVCCSSGNKLNIYSVKFPIYEFFLMTTIILPGLYSGFFAKPFTSNDYYGIPHNSRQIHILEIKAQQRRNLLLVDAKRTGHQIRNYGVSVTEYNIITYGFDGDVILHSLDTFEHMTSVTTHHYTDRGIKKAMINALNTHIVTLGHDGSIVCTALPFEVDLEKQGTLMSVISDPHVCISFTTRKTSGFISSTGLKDSRTWFELQEEIKLLQEMNQWNKEKLSIFEEFKAIRKQCVDLLVKNYNSRPEEQLPISAFDLDDATRQERKEQTQKICEKTDRDLRALMYAQNKLHEALKKRFWDPVEVKGRKLRAIMGKGEVESYAIFRPDISFEEELNWVKERRNLEVLMLTEDHFQPWDGGEDDEPETSIIKASLAGITSSMMNIREALSNVTTIQETEEEEDRIMKLALSGSTSHEFVKMFPNHHNQFEMTSYAQLRDEIILLMNVTNELRQYFNERFNEIYSLKEREMMLVAERNARLHYVLSEMNDTQTEVIDPTWTQDEQPERIMKVEDKEVPISPYVSPSQQIILDKLAAEAEALRLALLADNFRELALITMMDGVLEVRWEDEIKKDVPKPKCMLEKNPEDYNEEDLRGIKEYEEKVAFRLSERERYRKMLETEFKKLSQTLKEGVLKFNSRLADLFLLKLKLETAIGCENLKIIRAKVKVQKLHALNEKKKQLKLGIKNKEVSNAALQEKIQQLQIWTNDCRSAYETLVARDKNLEKNFKKEFPEVSQVVMEQLTKFYKRRPKIQQKAQMSVTLLNELSRCTTSTERPSFLPPEYLDFLKALDHIDQYSNSPPIINEELWNILCRVRRQKVECELKTRSAALEVAESEQTVNLYQKRLANEKQNLIALQDEIQKTKDDIFEIKHNTEIQLVIKGGLVEVKTTGSLSDFDDAVLITRNKVEEINELVKKAGKQKLAAMYRVSNFRRGILAKEWEHNKLKMEIQDLEDHLHNLESIKVTRDIQLYLRRRVQGMSEDKVILSLEREIQLLKESYENTIEDLRAKISDLNEKIEKQRKENRKLDVKITEVTVDVNEQQLQRDMECESHQSEATKQRMASIVKHSQLVALIQKQHTEIVALQTELELLRLKTYPTLKYKTFI